MQNDSKPNRTVFLTLLALSHGAMHGYEISKFIELKSNGFFRVSFGSLYPVLHKLEADKFVQAKWDAGESLKQKKTYSLTTVGKKALRDEVTQFKSLHNALSLLSMESL